MIFPIGDQNEKSSITPIITRLLVAINVIVFIYQMSLKDENAVSAFTYKYGMIPVEITNGMDAYTLITSMFLHGGLLHLLGNMLMLWIFGDNLEVKFGRKFYLLFYVVCGLVAALAQTFTDTQSQVPMVGASGAISGCLGAYLVLFPKNKVKILFFFIVFRIAAFIVIGMWAVGQVLSTYYTLSLKTAHTQSDNIAYAAHIGGFVAGMVWALVFRKKRKLLLAAS